MNRKHILLAILAITLGYCCGCVNLAKPQVQRNYFALQLESKPDHDDAVLIPGKPCLIIRNLTISPLFSGREFVYRLTDEQYQSDYYNLFFTQPANMLRELVADELADSQAYNLIHGTVTRIDPSYDLEIYVTTIYGDFRNLEAPRGHISLLAYLIHADSDAPSVVFSKSYSSNQDMAKRSSPLLVKAWEKGLSDILSELDKDISAAISKTSAN